MIESSFLYVLIRDHLYFWIQPGHHLCISKPMSFLYFSLILFNINKNPYQFANFGTIVCSHSDVKKVSFSFHRRFFITKQKWFSGVVHNLQVFSTDISYFFCEFECVGQKFFGYRRIEIFYVENSRLIPIFIWNFKKPFCNFTCIFPLVILRECLSWWFVLLRMFLLIQAISFFAGLIILTLGLFLKFGLWSLT